TWTARANMLAADNVPGGGVIGGKLYVFGGGNPFTPSNRSAFFPKNGIAAIPLTTNATQVYDPGTNTWSNGNPMGTARSFPSGTNVGSSYLIAVGGYNGSTTVNSVEVATAPGGPCVTATVTPTTPPTNTPSNTPTTPPSNT